MGLGWLLRVSGEHKRKWKLVGCLLNLLLSSRVRNEKERTIGNIVGFMTPLEHCPGISSKTSNFHRTYVRLKCASQISWRRNSNRMIGPIFREGGWHPRLIGASTSDREHPALSTAARGLGSNDMYDEQYV